MAQVYSKCPMVGAIIEDVKIRRVSGDQVARITFTDGVKISINITDKAAAAFAVALAKKSECDH